MDTDKIMIVDYSDKAIAIAAEYDTGLQDEFKAIGGRFNSRLAFGAGWIFSKKKHREQLDKLFSDYGISDMFTSVALADIVGEATRTSTNKTKTTSGATPDYILTDKQRREWARDVKGDEKYYYKDYNIIVRLADGELVPIKRNSLKTEFWFGESDCGQGMTSDEARAAAHNARTNEDYFLNENLEDLRDMIARLDGTYNRTYKYLWLANYYREKTNHWELDKSSVCPDATNAIEYLDCRELKMYEEGRYRKLSDDDKARLLTGYKLALQAKEKRCRAYLKRYGMSKITARVYWMDR